ncbi:hypothetical protein [Falsiroseomonas oryziterrae]|uniref:hypothetical protein n=1 Tax=Falsiroseomonas oryziterrae TaxID=2911368 RepID=UPI001F3D8140|nr:hypothetical protein [Roseomonas sp. NPKOSM-4]
MPWGEGPGQLPAMRRATGETLVALLVEARLVMLVGADELESLPTRDAWHDLADLLGAPPDALRASSAADRQALMRRLDNAIAALRAHRFRVVAGAGEGTVFVGVVPFGDRRDLRLLFAAA